MKQELAHHLLGASEAAAALGLHPFKAPLTLWLEKTGQAPAFEGNPATVWGTDIEPALRKWYAREFDVAVWVPPASILSAEHPWLRATPDGLVLLDADGLGPEPSNWDRGLEVKNAGWRSSHQWGEPGTDEVPSHYLIQCQQGCLVAGVDSWHLVASIGGAAPAVYEIRRDDELIAMIVEGTRNFMQHVADGTPPAIDGTEAWSEYVRDCYPWSREEFVQAQPADEVLVEEWKAVSAEIDRLERAEAELKNRIAATIGPASGMETSLGKITYRPRRGGPDYKAAFESLAEVEGYGDGARSEVLAAHQRRGSRPLVRPRSWSSR